LKKVASFGNANSPSKEQPTFGAENNKATGLNFADMLID
jgi:hypothetical protein